MKLRSTLAAALAAFALFAATAAAFAQVPGLGSSNPDEDEVSMPGATDRREAQPAGPNAKHLAGPVDPANYRLGPGDVLTLHARGSVSRDVPLEVGPEGSVMIPDDGLVFVAGRTLAEVRADILQRVRRLYRNVEVQLQLTRPRTFRIYLTGQVATPGPDLANGSFRVADVVTPPMLLGGASRRNIEVIHTDGSREPADLELFLQTGNSAWNPWLRDGDVIQVPTITRFVYVEGAVARPGRYELGQRDSVRTVLQVAGDPLPSAEPGRMLVVRFTAGAAAPESLTLALDDAVSGRVNPPLGDGDRVYVYFVPNYRQLHQATIVGEVRRPGTFPIHEGRTSLGDLVALSGGVLPSADLSTLRVHRAATLTAGKDEELERLLRLSRSDLTASEYEVLRTRLARLREDYSVDWTRLQADPALDLKLRDGDVVSVDRSVLAIRVDGEVRQPGLLNFVPGQSVYQYIERAGGLSNRAWRGKIRVTRVVTGQTLLARDVRTLDPGDFIWVPEKPDITQWERLKEMLVALAQVATIVIAIRSVR